MSKRKANGDEQTTLPRASNSIKLIKGRAERADVESKRRHLQQKLGSALKEQDPVESLALQAEDFAKH
eukprot:5040637-Amphidinium_carterae.1